MSRRAVGLALVGIGAFALVAALMVRLVLAPTMVRLPLDQEGSSTVSDSDATYLDMEKLAETDGPVVANVEVKGDATAEDTSDDVAVWHTGTTVATPDGTLVTAPSETINCLDRRTAEAVSCDAAEIDGHPTDITGLTVTFPLGTEKRDYQVWNGNVGKAFPATYAGEDEVDGVTVYRFEQTIPETVIDSIDVPGALAGVPSEPGVTADVVYSNERTLLVEPTSGKIVSAQEHPVTVLRGPDGEDGVTVLDANLAPSDDALSEAAAAAADTRDEIDLVKTILPWSVAGLGLVLLVVGALLVVSAARRSTPPGQHADTEQLPVAAA
jgi:hypothetical protein